MFVILSCKKNIVENIAIPARMALYSVLKELRGEPQSTQVPLTSNFLLNIVHGNFILQYNFCYDKEWVDLYDAETFRLFSHSGTLNVNVEVVSMLVRNFFGKP